MLVLSRRVDQRIVFPNLGVKLQLLRIQGNQVRIGIEAPPSVEILRDELVDETTDQSDARARAVLSHALCNKLNKIGLNLHLLERILAGKDIVAARDQLEKILAIFETVDRDYVASQIETPEDAAPVDAPKPSRRKMLVVDDDSNERELLAGLLSLQGCDCDTAADGEAALDYLASGHRPDFVLLDMLMPRRNGPETLRSIRANPRLQNLKVIAISGSKPEELGVNTGPGGFDAWFAKPLNPKKLLEALDRA